jgi:hypothetical protein
MVATTLPSSFFSTPKGFGPILAPIVMEATGIDTNNSRPQNQAETTAKVTGPTFTVRDEKIKGTF